jgi:hypothetical protein
MAKETRKGHAVDVSAECRLRSVDVAVRINPEHPKLCMWAIVRFNCTTGVRY